MNNQMPLYVVTVNLGGNTRLLRAFHDRIQAKEYCAEQAKQIGPDLSIISVPLQLEADRELCNIPEKAEELYLKKVTELINLAEQIKQTCDHPKQDLWFYETSPIGLHASHLIWLKCGLCGKHMEQYYEIGLTKNGRPKITEQNWKKEWEEAANKG